LLLQQGKRYIDEDTDEYYYIYDGMRLVEKHLRGDPFGLSDEM